MSSIMRPALCVALLLSLTGCGGGSSPSTPTPTTPTPPPPTNSSLTNLQYDETFQTFSTVLTTDISGTSFVNTSVSSRDYGSGATVTYDASSDSYEINLGFGGASVDQTFLPSDINSSNSNSFITVYEKTAGSTDHSLIFRNPGDPTYNLSYVTYGAWLGITGTDIETSYFVLGVPTETADVPTSGTATFTGGAEGYVELSNKLFLIAGDVILQADFETNTINGDFTDLQRLELSGAPVANYGFTGTASISGNSYSGTITGVDFLATGSWQGGFFGSGAAETGGTWIIDHNGHQSIGAFVAGQ